MDKDTINLIRHFFFKSMRNGWASPTAKSAISELPGAKSIRFSDGEFDLLDYYFVSLDSDYSYGTTTIWLAEKPVWIMHYGGWYNELVIPFLWQGTDHRHLAPDGVPTRDDLGRASIFRWAIQVESLRRRDNINPLFYLANYFK